MIKPTITVAASISFISAEIAYILQQTMITLTVIVIILINR